jgi:hypothetical protein
MTEQSKWVEGSVCEEGQKPEQWAWRSVWTTGKVMGIHSG